MGKDLLKTSWYGEGAVGVSAPALPLSFLRAERDSFSGESLSADRRSGVLLRRLRGEFAVIISGFR